MVSKFLRENFLKGIGPFTPYQPPPLIRKGRGVGMGLERSFFLDHINPFYLGP
jgi:hypothetical protein